jgi:hypothetical protein
MTAPYLVIPPARHARRLQGKIARATARAIALANERRPNTDRAAEIRSELAGLRTWTAALTSRLRGLP